MKNVCGNLCDQYECTMPNGQFTISLPRTIATKVQNISAVNVKRTEKRAWSKITNLNESIYRIVSLCSFPCNHESTNGVAIVKKQYHSIATIHFIGSAECATISQDLCHLLHFQHTISIYINNIYTFIRMSNHQGTKVLSINFVDLFPHDRKE